jgi:hypothetical protein
MTPEMFWVITTCPLLRLAQYGQDAKASTFDVFVSLAEIAVTSPEIIPNRDSSLTKNVKPCSPPPSVLGSGTGAGSRLAAWVIDSAPPLETLSKELGQITQNIVQLTRILEQIESMPIIDAEVT